MKTIAIVYDGIFPFRKGGAEKRFYDIALALTRRGLPVERIGQREWLGPKSTASEAGIAFGICHNIPIYKKSGRRSIAQALAFGLSCVQLLWREADVYDCCVFPFFSIFVVAAIARLRGARLVATCLEVWGTEYWRAYLGPFGSLAARIEKYSLAIPKIIISISQHTTRDLIALGVPPSRIRTIPIGLDLEQIARCPPEGSDVDLIYVGRLLPYKNVDVLIDAVGLLHERGRPVTLRVIGDGPLFYSLQARARARKVEGSVIFDGFVEGEIFGYMKRAKVLAAPSSREGFGIVAIEANACGIPVITSDERQNAMKELVSDRTGIVTAATAECLADAIESILPRAPQMRESCLSYASSFGWPEILPKLLEAYGASSAKAS